jgi:hypothetical protein
MDDSAFQTYLIVCEVYVEPGNGRFVVDHKFIVDLIDARLVRYFGNESEIFIWKEIEILGKCCFTTVTISLMSKQKVFRFESAGKLREIEEACFIGCSFQALSIPQTVEVLGPVAFASGLLISPNPHNFRNLSLRGFHGIGLRIDSVQFEPDSNLRRIDPGCFQ